MTLRNRSLTATVRGRVYISLLVIKRAPGGLLYMRYFHGARGPICEKVVDTGKEW